MILGITGSFGSGKTAVAKLFERYGYGIINADKIGHQLYNKTSIKNKVIKKFGKEILSNNKIDRNKLKKIVFYNKKELKKLNKIMWPEIIREIKTIIKKSGKKMAIDAAILIEAKALSLVDKLVVAKIDKKIQMKRLINKGKYTKQEIKNILSSQLLQNKKLKYADYIIDNSKSIKHTEEQVRRVVQALASRRTSKKSH